MSNIFEELTKSVIEGDEDRIHELTKQAIDNGKDPKEIIAKGLIAGMNVVGVRFKAGDMFVPEVLMCARAMKSGMELLKPLIMDTEMPSAGKVLVGTGKGDLHDIGKNLVAMMLTSAGFDVVDLGTDVAPEDFVEAVDSNEADILGMSALLTTTMPMMIETLAALESNSRRDKVKVMIGGAPVSRGYAEEIGADAYASDAGAAIKTAEGFKS